MIGDQIKEYLTFTRKERNGILILVIIIILLWLLPEFMTLGSASLSPAEKEAFLKEKAALEKALQEKMSDKEGMDSTISTRDEELEAEPKQRGIESSLFEFDPNHLPASGWKKLGLGENTIRTIQNYLSHGGKFFKPGDLGKIYGLDQSTFKRLLPYVRIMEEIRVGSRSPSEKPLTPGWNKQAELPRTIDINLADSLDLIALPGIGAKLTSRLLNFRNRLGGFHAIDQVAQTYGLPDSTFQKIRNRLAVAPGFAVRKININTADIELLRAHPYINYSLANVIVQYRNQHGGFRNLDDLQHIELMTPELYSKLSPYLEY